MPTKTDYILLALGAFAAVLLTSYVPSLMKVMASSDYANCPRCKEKYNTYPAPIENYMTPRIEDIEGIDLRSLNIVNQKNRI